MYIFKSINIYNCIFFPIGEKMTEQKIKKMVIYYKRYSADTAGKEFFTLEKIIQLKIRK